MNDERSDGVTETTVELHPGGASPSPQLAPAPSPVVVQPQVVAPVPVPAVAPSQSQTAAPAAPAQPPVAQPLPVAPAPQVVQPQAVTSAPAQAPAQQTPVQQASPVAVAAPPASPYVLPSDADADLPSREGVTWRAAEFVAHQKTAAWYLKLTAAMVVLTALIYVFTRDKVTTAMTLLVGIAFGVYAGRQPRELEYALDDEGVTIGGKFFAYDLFRSFAIMDEGQVSSLVFLPLKRFGQLITIYFDRGYEQPIVQVLRDRLPIEARSQDLVDRFMHRIHF